MKRLLNWINNLWHDSVPSPEHHIHHYPKVQIIQRDPCRLRMSEWCSSPELVSQANRCLHDAAFRQMLDVLDREHPANIVLADAATIELRAIWQARCEGYTMALANLGAMGEYNPVTEPLEATFEPPEQEQEPQ